MLTQAFRNAAIIVLAWTGPAWAWGQEGHSIIAEIAQRRLEPEPLQRVKELLGGEVSLASVSSWADDVRGERPETYNWHFVDIPLAATGYDPVRDCADTSKGDCVIAEIERAKSKLGDATADGHERVEALMFLVHFIGDVHQPLHCVADARGGNDVQVTLFGQHTNLHKVWDSGLIQHRVFDWGAYVTHIEADWLPGQDVTALASGTPVDWAEETHRAGIEIWNAVPPDHKLDDQYYQEVLPTFDRQLAVAGLRLARTLNEALTPGP